MITIQVMDPTEGQLKEFQKELPKEGEGWYWAFQNVMDDPWSKELFINFWKDNKEGFEGHSETFFGKFVPHYMRRVVLKGRDHKKK